MCRDLRIETNNDVGRRSDEGGDLTEKRDEERKEDYATTSKVLHTLKKTGRRSWENHNGFRPWNYHSLSESFRIQSGLFSAPVNCIFDTILPPIFTVCRV